MPKSLASDPLIILAVNINSFAIAEFIRRGNLTVPPAPGIIANRVSTKPNLAEAEVTLISHPRVNSNPPPERAYCNTILLL